MHEYFLHKETELEKYLFGFFNQKNMNWLSLGTHRLCRSSVGIRPKGSGAWEMCARAGAEDLARCTTSLCEAWLLFLLEVIGGQEGLALSHLLFGTKPDVNLIIHGDAISTPIVLFNSLLSLDK